MENKFIERLKKIQDRDVKNESWNGNLIAMKQEIIEHGIENFIEYPTIVKTMARGNERQNELYNKNHIRSLQGHTDIDVTEIDNIFEFGGGFGSLAKVLKKSLRNIKSYLIFDFEEFCILQEYYLQLNEVNGVVHIHDINRLERILKTVNGNNMFIAMWSLSEAPIELRNKIMNMVRSFNNIFIAYNSQFDGIDNVEYFNDIKEKFTEYEWTVWDASVEDSKYMYGVKK